MKQNIFTRLIAIIRKEAQPLLMPGALTPVVDGNVDFPQIVFEKGATERGFQR